MESKRLKRICSIAVVAFMIVAMLPAKVFAADTTDYSGYTYVAFGDSITYGIDGDYQSGEEGYRMEKPYPTLVAETLGIGTVVNQAKSGATWTQHATRTNMTERIMRYNGDADMISVMLGVNDYAAKCALGDMNSRDNTTIYGSIHMAAKHLTTKYPDAFIFFMTPFKYRTEDNGKYTLSDVAQAVKDVAAVYDIPVLDMYTNGQFDPATGAKDQIHPTQAHHITYTAPMICELIRQHNTVSKDACPCDACDGADATWISWDGTTAFENGKHYRLAADVQLTGVVSVAASTTVVLDLNGKTITAAADSRCFEVSGELSIINSTADTDADGNYTGLITGGKAATVDTDSVLRGGNINIEKGTSASNPGGTLKLYGGTIAKGQAPNAGGNVKVGKFAKFYMYGGSIVDGTASTSGSVGNGGNMNVDNGANFYMYGGTISGGTASASGGNIYSWKGTINLYDGLITGGIANATGSNRGGGNIWLNAANAKLNMYGGEISDGEAKRFGGNIYLDNASGKITMEGGVISGGKTTQHGGNIYASAGTVQMTGGVIKDGKANWDTATSAHTTATNDGGNIYLSGAKAYLGGDATVTGGSVGTATNQYGGNIYMTTAAELYLQDQVQILNGDAIDGKNIYAMTDAKVTMYGGTVKNGTLKTYNSGSFHMYGGQVEDINWTSDQGTQETIIYNGILGSNTSGLPEKLATWAADCATVTQTTHVEGHTVYAVYQTSLTNGTCATCGHTYSAANCGTCKTYSHPAVKVANCQFCNKDVVWAPLLGNELVADHYYLAEDVALTGKIGLAVDDAVCIDLNGYDLTTANVTTGITMTSAKLNIYNTSADASAIISGGGGILTANKASGEIRTVINLKDITVTGGRSVDNGGNIATNSVDLVLDNCVVSGGYAPGKGGNLCSYASQVTIKGNTRIVSGFAGGNGDDVYFGTTTKAQMYSGTVGDICQLNSTGSFHLYGGTIDHLTAYNYVNANYNYHSSFYMYGGTVNEISVGGKSSDKGNGQIVLYAGTVGNDPRTANNKNTTMVASCSCLTQNADGTYTVIHTGGTSTCEVCAANDVYEGGYSYGEAFTGQHTPAEAVKENVVAPSCDADGSYDLVTYCSVCGAELSRVATVDPATGHSHVGVYTPATNTENAYTTYTCPCGDSYVEVEEGTMLHYAVNEATGESYTSVQEALNAASKGATIKLLKDAAEEELFVGAGLKLDLNGKKLTVKDTLTAAFATSHIVDTTNGEGLLVLTGASSALNSYNEQLPMWTAEGVRFTAASFKQQLTIEDENTIQYAFYLNMDLLNSKLGEVLAKGTAGTGISIRIKVTYTAANGMTAVQYFTLTSDMVADYVVNSASKAIKLTVSGVQGRENLIFTAEIASQNPNDPKAATVVIDKVDN